MTEMFVRRVADDNPDLLAVNAARVSFGRFKTEFDDKDRKLLHYLAKHNHWSPFSHPRYTGRFVFTNQVIDNILEDRSLSAGIASLRVLDSGVTVKVIEANISLYGLFRLGGHWMVKETAPECYAALDAYRDRILPAKPCGMLIRDKAVLKFPELQSATVHVRAPIDVARQLVKHTQGVSWNEISRRYVDFEPEFYMWEEGVRKRAEDKKQGSAGEFEADSHYRALLKYNTESCLRNYHTALECGICPEQARELLPINMMTEWYWTTTIEHWNRILKQRLDSHAQKETQYAASLLREELVRAFPDQRFGD